MEQDPNQPYPGQYGQAGGVPPQQEAYQGGYQQQSAYQPGSDYQPPNPYQPNTGYQQPNANQYQQPYGQPNMQYNTGHPNGPTTVNMETNTLAGLSYLTWIAGLIIFLVEKQNRFARFHAMQSILLTVVTFVVWIIVGFIPFLGLVLGPLVWIAGFILWLMCVINAFQGRYFKLPVIGDYAERWSSPTPMVRM
jgi:uncharacterized membrane protein